MFKIVKKQYSSKFIKETPLQSEAKLQLFDKKKCEICIDFPPPKKNSQTKKILEYFPFGTTSALLLKHKQNEKKYSIQKKNQRTFHFGGIYTIWGGIMDFCESRKGNYIWVGVFYFEGRFLVWGDWTLEFL